MAASRDTQTSTPYRQIRALYDDETITVYQAYCPSIALAAVEKQKLNASPNFKLGRMTWIKPSWCWMMYRSGYAKKKNQEHILALKMKHSDFFKLLKEAVVCHGQTLTSEDRKKDVRVQWDPERGPSLELLSYRSIQIGISGVLANWWVEEGIVSIEDVTEKARSLWHDAVDPAKARGERVLVEECMEKGLMPREREFDVPEEVRGIIGMQWEGELAYYEEARKRDMALIDAAKVGLKVAIGEAHSPVVEGSEAAPK